MIKVTREKRVHGCLMPYMLVVNFDVSIFEKILVEAKNSNDENMLQKSLSDATILLIKNGETVEIETDKDSITLFATNGFFDNSKTHPLSISNMLTLKDGDTVTLKSLGGWLKGAELLLA